MLIFSDALFNCYSTAVYLRSFDEPSSKTNLIFAKTQLVPANKEKSKCKKLTIPRLELMATLIGVRTANFVTRELNVGIDEQILWTDSQCVLHWLKTKKPLPTYICGKSDQGNIVSEGHIILLHHF